MDTEMNRYKATQVDEGWRKSAESKGHNATEVDEGWRNSNDGRKVTEFDEGWRKNTEDNGYKATEVDEGWRNLNDGRKVTEFDEGWRENVENKGYKATEVDEGWRSVADERIDPANVINKATANFFSTLAEFQNAVARLPQLISSTNKVYPIKKTISDSGGESIILLCSAPDGNDVVAKVYYEPANGKGTSISTRAHILKYMITDEGKKYTLAVSDIGLVTFGESKYYFEIMPYCTNTDLSDDGAYSFDEIVMIVKQANEALHSIHKAGIIHRDIKPENLYILDGQIKLGDFGIARNGVVGRSKATEFIAGTTGYAAPETRRYVYNEKSDYYSLGVTLASLFEGHFIFENMTFEMMALAEESERLPLVRTDPNREQLENLLNGLCRINAKQRFGYEDVNCWLDDHNYSGGVAEEEWPKAFRMLGEEYRDEKSLFYGITKDEECWNEGKSMLFSKFFENFFMSFRTDLARAAQVADEIYHGDDRDKGLSVFLKSLYVPGPVVWKGYSFSSLNELGNKMVVAQTPKAYGEILQKHCISHWLDHSEGICFDENTKNLIGKIEALSANEPEVSCYWFGNAFASQRQLNICDKTVSTIPQLIETLFASPYSFYQGDGLRKLLDQKEGADLYGFLFSYGFQEIVEKEWEEIRKCDDFNKASLLFSLMDDIALKLGADPTIIRQFFIQYGPIGIATYTKQLISREENKVYLPLDAEGKQVVSKIKNFREPILSSIRELYRAYVPLVESVEKLRKILIDNPFCIATGVYENRGILCVDLVGCFAFNIFGSIAPLGFSALIETAKGGIK